MEPTYYPVLDHGFVGLIDVMGNDEAIEQAARVSYGKGTRKVSETRGLIRYLYRHRHTTPFEMVEFKFHVAMPMFVARQWIRHRTANVNEYSGRYSIMPKTFYTPEAWRKQSTTNQQGSSDEAVQEGFDPIRNRIVSETFSMYEWMTRADVAKELARIDLPLSTYTQWYWKIDLHNLLHFLKLRCDPHAQWEIRAFANIMAGIVKQQVPLAFEAWFDYSLRGANLSRMELEALRGYLESVEAGSEVPLDFHLDVSEREREEFLKRFDFTKAQPDYNFELPREISADEAHARFFGENDDNP